MRFIIPVLTCSAVIGLLSTSLAMAANNRAQICDNNVTAGDMVSKTLMKMESPAEDMLDMLVNNNRVELKRLYKNIGADMIALNQLATACVTGAQSRSITLQNSWFDLIRLEMKEMDDMPALAFAINQFSGQLIIATDFKPESGKNVAWMDYLGRELLILNQYSHSDSNQTLVTTRKCELQKTWKKLRPLVMTNPHGPELVHEIDLLIRSLMRETQAEKLVMLANQELKAVDKIEGLFHIN